MCTKGRRQSPIDIEPDKLLFDPHLRSLHIDKHKVKSNKLLEYLYLIRSTMKWLLRDWKKITCETFTDRSHDNINNAILCWYCCCCCCYFIYCSRPVKFSSHNFWEKYKTRQQKLLKFCCFLLGESECVATQMPIGIKHKTVELMCFDSIAKSMG